MADIDLSGIEGLTEITPSQQQQQLPPAAPQIPTGDIDVSDIPGITPVPTQQPMMPPQRLDFGNIAPLPPEAPMTESQRAAQKINLKRQKRELQMSPEPTFKTGFLASLHEDILPRRVYDPALTAVKAAMALPEGFVGIADIVTGGHAGKALDGAGVQFKKTREILESYYSPEQQEANKNVADAQGFFGTVGAMLENPSTIFHTTAESLPSMLGGAAIGKGVMKLAPKIAPLVGGAIGDGVFTAGQNIEQVRQGEKSGLLSAGQTVVISASGFTTGLISMFGGKLAKRLGVDDLETIMVGGKTEAQKKSIENIAKRVVGSIVIEGGVEEFNQSMLETVAQNLAQGKPWHEGVVQAGVQGMFAGGLMGGGAAISQIGIENIDEGKQRKQRLGDLQAERNTPGRTLQLDAIARENRREQAAQDLTQMILQSGVQPGAKPVLDERGGLTPFWQNPDGSMVSLGAVNIGGQNATNPKQQPAGDEVQPQGVAPVGQAQSPAGGANSSPGAAGKPAAVTPIPPQPSTAVIPPVAAVVAPLKQGESAPVRFHQLQESSPGIHWFEVTAPLSAPDGSNYKPGAFVSNGQLAQWGFNVPPAEGKKAQEAASKIPKQTVQWNGLSIAVENPQGSIRSGYDKTGKPWSVQMQHPYGYVEKTKGMDKEPVDIYLGTNPNSDRVFVFDQHNPDTGKHDEHKSFAGFDTPDQAADAYHKAFPDGSAKDRFGAAKEFTVAEFKDWLADKKQTQKPIRALRPKKDSGGVVHTSDWRKSFAESDDIETKIDWLRVVANKSGGKSTPEDLAEVLKLAEQLLGQQKHSRLGNTLWDVAHNSAASPETKARALALYEDFYKSDPANHDLWQMTKAEYSERVRKDYGRQGFPDLKAKQAADATHAKAVADAVSAGIHVPSKVLADYPDLKQATPPASKDPLLDKILARYAELLPGIKSDKSAQLLFDAITKGEYNHIVDPSNNNSRRIFTEITGIKLPKTIKGSKEVFKGESLLPESVKTPDDKTEAVKLFQKGEQVVMADGVQGEVQKSQTQWRETLEVMHPDGEIRRVPFNSVTRYEKPAEKPFDPIVVIHVGDKPKTEVKSPVDKTKELRDSGWVVSTDGKKWIEPMTDKVFNTIDDAYEQQLLRDKVLGPSKNAPQSVVIERMKARLIRAKDNNYAHASGAWFEITITDKEARINARGITITVPIAEFRKGDLTNAEILVGGNKQQIEDVGDKPKTESPTLKGLREELKKLRQGLPVAEDMSMNDNGASLDKLNKKIADVQAQIDKLAGSIAYPSDTAAKPKTEVKSPLSNLSADDLAEFEKLEQELIKKLGQTNISVDPDVALLATRMAGLYAKGGVKTFEQFAKNVKERMPTLWERIKAYLRAAWNQIADMMNLDDVSREQADAVFAGLEKESKLKEEKSNEQRPLDKRGGGAESSNTPSNRSLRKPRGNDGAGRVDSDKPESNEGVGGGRKPDAAGAGSESTGGTGAVPSESGGDDASGTTRDKRDLRRPEQPVVAPSENYVISDADKLGQGGIRIKVADNFAAIKLVKKLDAENRQPTQEEKAVLVRYVGWGGIKGVFVDDNKDLARERAELKELLTPEEYETARASIQDAHYTSQTIIQRGLYAAMRRFGFRGGKMVEGGVGIGNMIGLMPADMAAVSSYLGIERDGLTGKIARYLYPKATIRIEGYQESQLSRDHFDGAVGNPPFGKKAIYDKNFKESSKFTIHNYFIGKTLELTRPGGIVAQVVSRYFLDNSDPQAREYIATLGEFLGAIRLPNTAFKENANTEVVTDLVFFKRVPQGTETNTDWTKVVDYKDAKSGITWKLNKWIVEHPEMILGEIAQTKHGLYSKDELTVKSIHPDRFVEDLQDAVEKLPKNVYEANNPEASERLTTPEDVSDMPEGVKVHGYYVKGGDLFRRLPDVNGERSSEKPEMKEGTAERVKAIIPVRDAFNKLVDAELNLNSSDTDIENLRGELNKAYDTFYKKFGYLNSPTNRRAFYEDGSNMRILGLERDYISGLSAATAKKKGVDEIKPSAKKADIFKRRVNTPYREVTSVDTSKEALSISLNQRGSVDLDYMAELVGKDKAAMLGELGDLVFQTPAGEFVSKEQYLSGNVRAKLGQAEEAAKTQPQFQKNVEALTAVIPKDIEPTDIIAPIGAPWISAEDISAFAKELTDSEPRVVLYLKSNAGWSFEHRDRSNASVQKWGTPRMPFGDMMKLMLNGKPVIVYDMIEGPSGNDQKVVNQQETELAGAKAAELRDKWQEWIWSDKDRRDRLARIYNDNYNNYVDFKADGSHLTFPGASSVVVLNPHQKNVAWRTITNGGEGILYDQVVGSGKTFAGVAAMMEMRRLGRVRKWLVPVPNHLTGQWADAFSILYPNANVLAAKPSDFTKENRQRFFAKALTGDYDAVIVGHSSLKKIGTSAEVESELLSEMLSEIMETIKALKDAEGNSGRKGGSRQVSQLERTKDNIQAKLDRLADIGGRDTVASFEELGFDGLMLDEAHEFKNLYYTTQMQNVAGMGDPTGSAKAFDLYLKTRFLRKRFGGKAPIVFLTGTPISNSLVEMFTMQRYLQPQVLDDMGLKTLDAWARVFADIRPVYEVDPTGTGYRMATRLANFQNVGELTSIYRNMADVITMNDLQAQAEVQGKRFPVPKVTGGKPEIFVAERTTEQAEYFGVETQVVSGGIPQFEQDGITPIMAYPEGTILWRVDNMPDDPREDNMLKLTNDARKAGLDMRLINPSAPDRPQSKINVAVSEIVKKWQESGEQKGTQLVFCDLSVPSSARGKATKRAKEGEPVSGYYINVNQRLQAVEASPLLLKAAPGYDFFVRKSDTGNWVVSERTSGLSIGVRSGTKKGAIAAAEDRLASLPEGNFARSVAEGQPTPEQLSEFAETQKQADTSTDETADSSDDTGGEQGISADELLADQSSFSVYDDMKAKLIKAGIPEKEIAFIHDYDTPEKKQQLFKRVNAGDVRILFGSTAKMGAGTNVQKRIVALHHMDAPWRPSDLEQREGRAIRQGNDFYTKWMFPDWDGISDSEFGKPRYANPMDYDADKDPKAFSVAIKRYATALTYDTRMWQLIEHKAAGIEGFRKADRSTRKIEDVGGEAANASDMKAAASGDPLIQQELQLRNEATKLALLKKAWDRNRIELQNREAYLKDYDKRYTSRVDELDARKKILTENTPVDDKGKEVFKVTMPDGKDTDERGVPLAYAMDMIKEGKRGYLGKYRGFDFSFEPSTSGSGDALIKSVTFYVGKNDFNFAKRVTAFVGDEKLTGVGLFQRFDNYLEVKDTDYKIAEDKRNSEKATLEEVSKEVAKKFPKEAELVNARTEHETVRTQLMNKKRAKVAPQTPPPADDGKKGSIANKKSVDGNARSDQGSAGEAERRQTDVTNKASGKSVRDSTDRVAKPTSSRINLDEIPQEGNWYKILPKGEKDPLSHGDKFFLSPDNRWILTQEHNEAAIELLNGDPENTAPGDNPYQEQLELEHGFVRVKDNGDELYFSSSVSTSQLRELKNVAIENKKKLIQDIDQRERVLYDPSDANASRYPVAEPAMPSAPVSAKSVAELKALLEANATGLNPEQAKLIGEFLKSKLAAKLPALRFFIADALDGGLSGSYLDRLIEIARGADAAAGPHEFLHAVWEILPADIKAELGRMRRRTIEDMLADPETDALVKPLLQDLLDNPIRDINDWNRRNIPDELAEELYPLSSDEEYFTNLGSAQFKAKVGSKVEGFWSRVKEIIKDMIAALRKALRLSQSQEQLLRNILNGNFTVTPETAATAEANAGRRKGSIKTEEEADDAGEGVPQSGDTQLQYAGHDFIILGKERMTPQQLAQGEAMVRDYFENDLKLPGSPDTSYGKKQGAVDTNVIYTVQADGKNHDDAGRKLLATFLEQAKQQFLPGGNPAYTAGLANAIKKNYVLGNFDGVFSQPLIDELFQFTASDSTTIAQALRARTGLLTGDDIRDVAKNVPFFIKKLYHDAYGGDLINKTLKKLMTAFRGFFTPEEIEEALKPANVPETVNRLIQMNANDSGNRVYQAVNRRLKPQKAKTEAQMQRRALEDEAIEAMIRHAAELGQVEPEKLKNQKLTPDEQLALVSKPAVAKRIQAAADIAVKNAEFNAGWRAEEIAANGDQDALDEIAGRKAMGEEPSPEMVEEGLKLPEYKHWQVLRDDLLNYSPTTVKLVEDVIKKRFKATKFGEPIEKPEDLRIDMKKLAVSPEDEVTRVFNAQMEDVKDLLADATPETIQRVSKMFQDRIVEQLAIARKNEVDKMFKDKATGKETPSEIEAIKKQINAGLLADRRLNDPELAQKAAEKSTIKNLLPNVKDLITQILESPRYKLEDIKGDIANALVSKLGLKDDQAKQLSDLIYKSLEGTKEKPGVLIRARQKALEKVVAGLAPEDKKILDAKAGIKPVVKKDTRKTLWSLIEQGVRAGLFDPGTVLEDIASRNAWNIPSPDEKAQMKKWSEEEQRLRTPSQRLIDENLGDVAKATDQAEKATDSERVALIKKMQANWSRWAHPVGLKHWLSGDRQIAQNNAKAINEIVAANLLMKAGFAVRQFMAVVPVDMTLNALNRSLAHVVERAQADGGFSDKTIGELQDALKEAAVARVSSFKATLRTAERTMKGHSNRKVLDRMTHSIGVFDRMLVRADALEKEGQIAKANAIRLSTVLRAGYRVAEVFDAVQALGLEWQEMRQQLSTELHAAGKSRAEIALILDDVFGGIKIDMTQAKAQAVAIAADLGITKDKATIEDDAWRLVKGRAYDRMRAVAGTGTDYEAENETYRELNSWNLPIRGGVGGLLGETIKGLKSRTEKLGIPTGGIFSFGNAMGTATDRMLTFMGGALLPEGMRKMLFGDSPWHEGPRNQNQRRSESIEGLATLGIVLALVVAGIARIWTKYPKDKEEKERFIASGLKLNALQLKNKNGDWIQIPLQMQPFSYIASGLYMIGGLQDIVEERHKAQKALNDEAEKKGLTPGKIDGIGFGDVASILAQGMYGALTGGRTASGAIQSFTDYGNFNLNKAVSGIASPYIPGLPLWQETARMMGAAMDTRTATMLELMVPTPWSAHQRLNSLGEPMSNPNDVTRVLQVLSGGFGFGNDKSDPSSHAYEQLFNAGFSSPAVNPNKGYNFDGSYRPMSPAELEAYSVAKGKAFKEELAGVDTAGMDEKDAKKAVQAAYQRANQLALESVGAAPARQKASQGGVSASRIDSGASESAAPTGTSSGGYGGAGRPAGSSRMPSLRSSYSKSRSLRPRTRRITRPSRIGGYHSSLRARKPLKFKKHAGVKSMRSLRVR